MLLPASTVGRKILMAITGQIMIIFVVIHVLGNSTIYFSTLNAYAAALHALPFLLWANRLVMFSMLCLHVWLGIVITLENARAKPQTYAVTNRLSATFAGRNMIWTGAMIAAFLVYHLLHFTVQVLMPQSSALRNPDSLGRPDVFMMVVQSFRHVSIAAVYVLSVAALLLHLMHGIQSSIQTWGANNDRTMPLVRGGGTLAAVLLFLGYAAIPVVIAASLLK
jgi:succinate dehydrogenase / fumarate reductase cytochrome b subunit